jgi:hypothetical protein
MESERRLVFTVPDESPVFGEQDRVAAAKKVEEQD